MRCQIDISYVVRQPLLLQKYHTILDYDPKIFLANLFGFFNFDLFNLLILIPGIHYYIVLVWLMYLTSLVNFQISLCLMKSNGCMPLQNIPHQNLLHIKNLSQWIDINSVYSIWY